MSRYFHSQWLQILVIVVATFLAYVNILNNNFVWDDLGFIKQWETPRHFTNLPKFLDGSAPIGFEGVYRPVKILILALNVNIFGFNNPLMFHLQGIILHISITLLIYFIVKKLTTEKYIPFLASILFGLASVHSESVNFATASLDLFGILFILIAYLFFLEYKLKNKPKYIWTSLAFSVLGYFSNELTLPFFILVYLTDYLLFANNRTSFSRRILSLLYFSPIVVYFFIRVIVFNILSRQPFVFENFLPTVLITFKTIVYYTFVLFLPLNLNVMQDISGYPGVWGNKELLSSQSLLNPIGILGLIILISLVFLAIFLRRKKPLVAFALSWILVCFLPFANIFPVGVYYSERYLYLLSFGFYLLIVMTAVDLVKYLVKNDYLKDLVKIFFIIICLFYFLMTWWRSFDWKNDLSLWKDTVTKSPNNYEAVNNLGVSYVGEGKVDKAIPIFEKAIRLNPHKANYYANLGNAYYSKKNLDKALVYWQKANSLDPKNEFYATKLIQYYYQQKEYDKAIKLLNNVNFNYYKYLQYYFNGKIYLDKNKIDDAINNFNKTISIKPYSPAFVSLAEIYLIKKDLQRAEEMAGRAVESSRSISSYSTLAKVYLAQKKFDLALVNIDKALVLDPNDKEALQIKDAVQGYFQNNLLEFLQNNAR